MDDRELRVRCLEAAMTLAGQQRPLVHHDEKGVVEIATKLYHFCNAPQAEETPPGTEDKPARGQLRLNKGKPLA